MRPANSQRHCRVRMLPLNARAAAAGPAGRSRAQRIAVWRKKEPPMQSGDADSDAAQRAPASSTRTTSPTRVDSTILDAHVKFESRLIRGRALYNGGAGLVRGPAAQLSIFLWRIAGHKKYTKRKLTEQWYLCTDSSHRALRNREAVCCVAPPQRQQADGSAVASPLAALRPIRAMHTSSMQYVWLTRVHASA